MENPNTFFYKSEKSEGRVSTSLIFHSTSIFQADFVQNILSHKTLISLKILSGEEYFVTSKPKSHAIFGNTNIDKTITQSQIRAYLIELIAGLILSSFQPDNISKTHPHKIYNIENIQANKTIIEIANNKKSQISILELNNVQEVEDQLADIAKAVSTNIKNKIKKYYRQYIKIF